jgi:hypothetical protein
MEKDLLEALGVVGIYSTTMNLEDIDWEGMNWTHVSQHSNNHWQFLFN